jgi:hypothetical protein
MWVVCAWTARHEDLKDVFWEACFACKAMQGFVTLTNLELSHIVRFLCQTLISICVHEVSWLSRRDQGGLFALSLR